MSIVPRASVSDDSRTANKQFPKCLLLRDYLLNDISSCSSNGFRSYPRRPSTTGRFLVEMELNKNSKLPMNQHRPPITKSETNWKSNLNSKQSSMLQRASTLMIKAFKHFPFVRTSNLPRKILKFSLWKKSDHRKNEVKQLKSLGDLLKETEVTRPPSDLILTAVTNTTELTSSNSNIDNNSNSNSNNKSDIWSSSDRDSFTTVHSFDVELAQHDVVDDLLEDKKLTEGNRVGATTTTATVTDHYDNTENSKKWQDEQEEQCSPVSVMDFPSDIDNDVDDDDEVSSMFQHRHLYVEAPKKFTHKGRRFEDVPQVEPVRLEDRIAQSILESSTQKCSNFAQKENESEKKAIELLHLMKSTTAPHHRPEYEEVENLLLDFFKEKMVGEKCYDNEMLQIAKDWMDGQAQEMVLEWECPNDRQIYVTEMEEELRWSKYDDEVEKHNMSFKLEFVILNSLVNDVLLDFLL